MNNNDKNKKKKSRIKDLSNFVSAEDLNFDPYGSYTGTTYDTYYGDEFDDPVQDADDL